MRGRAPPVAVTAPMPARIASKQYLLRPVNPGFIAASLLIAFILNLLPWGRLFAVPDFVALTLVFWNIHQPRRVGMGAAFLMGILMDVHTATRLGECALAYTILSYGDRRAASGMDVFPRIVDHRIAVAARDVVAARAAATPAGARRDAAHLIASR
jgi:rod shape-determining protein MreD